jgi:MFS family permease
VRLTQVFRDEEFRGGGGLLAASVLGIGFGLSAMGLTYTLGAFVKPLSVEFGATRQQILSVALFATLAVVPSSLAAGAIVDRFGERRLTLFSQLGFAAIFVALGLLTTGLTSLYALYFLMPLVAIGTTPITFGRAIAARFVRHRGFALGIALAGTGLCALLVPPYLAWAMERWGWRGGYVALAAFPLLLAFPSAYAWLRAPASARAEDGRGPATGTARSGADAAPASTQMPAPSPAPGIDAATAFRGRRFWTMMTAFFIVSSAATGLLTNAVPMLVDRGQSPLAAASALSVFGVAVVVGRLSIGILVDRYWAPAVGALFLIPAGAALLTLLPSGTSWAWTLGALAIAGLATGAEFDLCSYLTARYFGLRAYGRIYGALYVAFAGGAGAVAPVFGGLYEHYGSYAPVLMGIAAGYVVCALLLLTLGRFPEFDER